MNFPTAQLAYAELVKAKLSPAFRARGWIGSGGKYQLPSESHWVLAGLQKSAFSDREDVTFVVNLLAIGRVDLAAPAGQGQTPKASQGFPPHGTRLGRLAFNRDVWWSVSPGTDLTVLAETVMTTLDKFGTPWFTARSAEEAPLN